MANAPTAGSQSTLDRINGRLEAEALLDLRERCGGTEYNQAFALELRRFADSVLGPVETSLRVMDHVQARDFEEEHIGFGQYQGSAYHDVPIDYLAWVADQANNLAAYLRSDRGKRRLRNSD